ncbi:integrating conjugative element protein [Saezia sanguinis]|uniref:integrating conjugative element protein n=1 Tax=Saezia sanguinis TaxID=1965230 RepID=UPI00302FD6E1
MKTSTNLLLPFCMVLTVLMTGSHALAQPAENRLIVVQDRGGTSALPYYEASGLTAEPSAMVQSSAMEQPFALAQPVVSQRLVPGKVMPRTIHAPGLTPFFIIGDDDLSRRWLEARYPVLQKLGAFGLVVNVSTMDALQSLRQLVPGLTLSAVPGDDLAHRLQLDHYPALIMSTGIEQ